MSKPPPVIQILLPTYNRSAMLAACLESIIAQKDVDVRIFLLDNGSTDDTMEVIVRYSKFIYSVESVPENHISNVGKLYRHVKPDSPPTMMFADDDLLLDPHFLWNAQSYLHLDSCIQFVTAEKTRLVFQSGGSLVHNAKPIIDFTSEIVSQDVYQSATLWRGGALFNAFKQSALTGLNICQQEWIYYLEALRDRDHYCVSVQATDGDQVAIRQHSGSDSTRRGYTDKKFLEGHLAVWDYYKNVHGEEYSEMQKLLMRTIQESFEGDQTGRW